MSDSEQSDDNIDLRIMTMMRQTLSAIAKDTVPPPGMKHPLSQDTIESIRQCLAVISRREHELGANNSARPRFVDEPQTSTVISLDSLLDAKKSKQ